MKVQGRERVCVRESRERTEKELLDPRVLFSHLTPLGVLKGWPSIEKDRPTQRAREKGGSFCLPPSETGKGLFCFMLKLLILPEIIPVLCVEGYISTLLITLVGSIAVAESLQSRFNSSDHICWEGQRENGWALFCVTVIFAGHPCILVSYRDAFFSD